MPVFSFVSIIYKTNLKIIILVFGTLIAFIDTSSRYPTTAY